MNLFKEFFPTTLYQGFSLFSGPVKVIELRGERRLMVGGLVQSINLGRGSINHKVWGRLSLMPNPKKNLSILILGLGAGTVAQLLSRRLKPSKIVGVEIDPLIVDIGQKFFDLDKVKSLEVVVRDAGKFVQEKSGPYNFIVVDTYRGGVFPRSFSGPTFLKRLKVSLVEGGTLVFNRIFSVIDPSARLEFSRRLEKIFGEVKEEVIEGPSNSKNYLYWATPSRL